VHLVSALRAGNGHEQKDLQWSSHPRNFLRKQAKARAHLRSHNVIHHFASTRITQQREPPIKSIKFPCCSELVITVDMELQPGIKEICHEIHLVVDWVNHSISGKIWDTYVIQNLSNKETLCNVTATKYAWEFVLVPG
jgi:hypothetical protein